MPVRLDSLAPEKVEPVRLDSIGVQEPKIYDGLTPDETYKKSGEVFDAAMDMDISIRDTEIYPTLLNDPQGVSLPEKTQIEKTSTVAPWLITDIPEQFTRPKQPEGLQIRADRQVRTFWKKFKDFFTSGRPDLPPDADRMEKIDRAFDVALSGPLRTFVKIGKGMLLNTPDIAWAALKRIVPEDVWDSEVRNMTLDEAMDWAAGYDPSGFQKMAGEIGEFVGRVRTIGPLLDKAGIINRIGGELTVLEQAAERALLFGGATTVEQIAAAASNVIDPTEAEFGYEGPIAVLRDMALGAAFSMVESGVSAIWKKITPSEQVRLLKTLGLKKGATNEEIREAAEELIGKYRPETSQGLREEFGKAIAQRAKFVTEGDVIFRGQTVKFTPKLLPGEKVVAGAVVKAPVAAIKPAKPAKPLVTPPAEIAAPEAVETIRAAAFELPDGTVLEGTSHPSIFNQAKDEDVTLDLETAIAGFATSEGRFVTREEAAEIAGRKKALTAHDIGPFGIGPEKIQITQPPTPKAEGKVEGKEVNKQIVRIKIHQPSGIPPFGGGIREIEGTIVDLPSAPPEFDYVAYEQGDKTWRIVERTTGLSIAGKDQTDSWKTLKKALSEADKIVTEAGLERTRLAISKSEKLNPVLTQLPTGKQVKLPETAIGGVKAEKPAGLSKAEREHLGPREARALIGGQKLGEKIGFKEGERRAALEGKRRLDRLRVKIKMTEKSVEDVKDVIRGYVPKEEQQRFIGRLVKLSQVKEFGTKPLTQKVQKLTDEIQSFVELHEKRLAVRDFKKFTKDTLRKFRVGEEKLGALPPALRDKLKSEFEQYDLAKLSDQKRGELEAHDTHIKNIAGSIANAFEGFEDLDLEAADIIQLPNNRIEALRRIEKTHIGELSTEQIVRLQNELESLIATNTKKQQSIGRRKFERIQKQTIDSRNEIFDRGITAKGERKEQGRFKQIFDLGQAQIRTLARKMSGVESEATEKVLVDNIYDMLRVEDSHKKDFWVAAEKMVQDAGIDASHIKRLDKEIKITLGGKAITVPEKVLLNMWLDSRADGNLRRLLTAKGHIIHVKDKKIDIGKITLDEIQALEYPDYIEKLGNIIFKHNRDVVAPRINETSMAERFYELAVHENHWPFPRFLDRPVEGKRAQVSQPIESIGRYQPRTGGTQTHQIFDPIEVWIRGFKQDARYISTAEGMQELRSTLANKAWRQKIQDTGNAKILEAYENIIRIGQGLISDTSIAEQTASGWLGTFAKGTLIGAPATGVIQIASIPAAHEVVERRYFFNPTLPTKAEADKLMELSPTLWWRWKARQFDYVTGAVSSRNAFRKMVTGKEGITNRLLDILTWGDQKAILRIWEASQRKITTEQGLERGTKEHTNASLDLLHKALETQPNWGAFHRSGLTLSKNFGIKSFAMFMSARNAQLQIFQRALDDLAKGRITKARFTNRMKDLGDAAVRVTIIRELVRKSIEFGTLALLAGLGIKEWQEIKDKLDEEVSVANLGDLAVKTGSNLIGLSVFGGVVAQMGREAIKGLGGKTAWERAQSIHTGNPITDSILTATLASLEFGLLANQIITQERYANGPKRLQLKWPDTALSLTNKTGELVSQTFGLPWSGPRRDIVWPIQRALRPVEPKVLQLMKTFNAEYTEARSEKRLRTEYLLSIGDVDSAINIMAESADFSVLKKLPDSLARKYAPSLYYWNNWGLQEKALFGDWLEKEEGQSMQSFVNDLAKDVNKLDDKTIANDPLIKSLIEWSNK